MMVRKLTRFAWSVRDKQLLKPEHNKGDDRRRALWLSLMRRPLQRQIALECRSTTPRYSNTTDSTALASKFWRFDRSGILLFSTNHQSHDANESFCIFGMAMHECILLGVQIESWTAPDDSALLEARGLVMDGMMYDS